MYQAICFNRGTEAEGGGRVNVAQSLSPPVILCLPVEPVDNLCCPLCYWGNLAMIRTDRKGIISYEVNLTFAVYVVYFGRQNGNRQSIAFFSIIRLPMQSMRKKLRLTAIFYVSL